MFPLNKGKINTNLNLNVVLNFHKLLYITLQKFHALRQFQTPRLLGLHISPKPYVYERDKSTVHKFTTTQPYQYTIISILRKTVIFDIFKKNLRQSELTHTFIFFQISAFIVWQNQEIVKTNPECYLFENYQLSMDSIIQRRFIYCLCLVIISINAIIIAYTQKLHTDGVPIDESKLTIKTVR